MKPGFPYGVIILDKPPGQASNHVLGQLKRLLGLRRSSGKIGFLGTLDPLATGVLPVFVGKATKLIPAFEGLDKCYRVTIRLGQRTDTYDAEGSVVDQRALGELSPETVQKAIEQHEGEYEQAAPAYSAVKTGGVPAYKLARAGRPAPRRVRTVTIHDVAVEDVSLPEATFTVRVSAGTYVRSLVDDIGQQLGVGAHVTALRRLACGCLFTVEKSITVDRIESALARCDTGFVLNPSQFLVDHLPLTVEESTERQLRDGRTIPLEGDGARLAPEAKVKALRPSGALVAIGRVVQIQQDARGFQPTKVLV